MIGGNHKSIEVEPQDPFARETAALQENSIWSGGNPASCIGLPRGWYIFWCLLPSCVAAGCKSRDSLEVLVLVVLEMGKDAVCPHFLSRAGPCVESAWKRGR